MRYEVFNTGGCGSIMFDTLEEAQSYMEREGYVYALSNTIFAGTDEDGEDVYADGDFYFRKSDLPDCWESMDDYSLMDQIYCDGSAPCIYPRV